MRTGFFALLVFASSFFLSKSAIAQEESSDSFAVISGSVNVSVVLANNMGINSQPSTGMVAPSVMVGLIQIGYQYNVDEKWGVNTSFGIGYQPFKFRTVDEASKDIFNETVFMMPYFGLSLELKRRFNSGLFFSAAANIHVNTLANYSARYNVVNSQISSFNHLYLERNLNEYAGVQHGIGFSMGKQITTGNWSGIDIFATALLLNRQKLVIDYWTYNMSEGDLPSGKISYSGSYFGLGVCYNFINE